MSLGGGGGGDNEAMMQMLRDDRNRAQAEADRLKAENDKKEADAEAKRVQRAKSGGLTAFTTNGFAGYADKTLGGGGNSLTAMAGG